MRTKEYWYRIQTDESLKCNAVIRWEYAISPENRFHCRHHTQLPVELGIGPATIDLDKVHLPTGWVTIEEVIRFMITDLDLQPPCGTESWDEILTNSELTFQRNVATGT